MATLVRKDERINIPDNEIIAVVGATQLGKPVVRVICQQFDLYGRELLLK